MDELLESQNQRYLEGLIAGKRCAVCEAVPDQLRVGYREGRFIVLCGCPGPTLEVNLVKKRRSALSRYLAGEEPQDALVKMIGDRIKAKRKGPPL